MQNIFMDHKIIYSALKAWHTLTKFAEDSSELIRAVTMVKPMVNVTVTCAIIQTWVAIAGVDC